MTSSIYPIVVSLNTPTISADSDILSSSIPINTDQVKPGGGGILRLSFSFVFGSSPSIISVFNEDNLKGTLNADNSSEIIDDGYYRFDIDVEAGDAINLKSSQTITAINFLRAHLVQFGA